MATTPPSPPLPVDAHRRTSSAAAAERQLLERGRRIKAAADLGLARSSRGRQWGRALRRRLLLLRRAPAEEAKPAVAPAAGGATEGEEAVQERVAALRRLVPGGEEMAVERLLEETADYIAALRAQVGAMRALTCLLGGLERSPETAAKVEVAVDGGR